MIHNRRRTVGLLSASLCGSFIIIIVVVEGHMSWPLHVFLFHPGVWLCSKEWMYWQTSQHPQDSVFPFSDSFVSRLQVQSQLQPAAKVPVKPKPPSSLSTPNHPSSGGASAEYSNSPRLSPNPAASGEKTCTLVRYDCICSIVPFALFTQLGLYQLSPLWMW